MKQWDRVKHVHWAPLAHSTHLRGSGTYDGEPALPDPGRVNSPTRPVGFVNVMLAPQGTCRVSQCADVMMPNRYYGWYVNTGDLAGAERAWTEELSGWATEGKPIVISEHAADTLPGKHSLRPQPWSEEHQVQYLEMNHAPGMHSPPRRKATMYGRPAQRQAASSTSETFPPKEQE